MKAHLLLAIFLITGIVQACGQTKKDSLYVFVGEKISVTEFHPKVDSNRILMDQAFKAKYKVIKNIYGKYTKDTIEFVAYDHYGIPAFSKYKNVLLYVSNINGELYHQKYQFSDVYKTKNGRWASSYNAGDYEHDYNKGTAIQPVPIEFVSEVSYSTARFDKETTNKWFPAPYYKIKANRAIVLWGNYLEELFELKKSGILKAREIFP